MSRKNSPERPDESSNETFKFDSVEVIGIIGPILIAIFAIVLAYTHSNTTEKSESSNITAKEIVVESSQSKELVDRS